MKTIAILGIGAIGSVIANSLQSNADNRLSYFSRTSKNSIQLMVDGKKMVFPFNIQLRNEAKTKPDWLIICLKAYHFEDAKLLIGSLISEHTKVAVIRNGLNLKDPILPFTSANHILECMIDCPTQVADNGYYEQLRRPIISVPKNSLSNAFTELFDQNKVSFNQVTDFKTASWKKLIESSALGAILCLTGETCKVFENKNLVELHQKLVQEGIQVALADGADIGEEFENELGLKLQNYPLNKGSSMLTDRLKGRPIEINAKNGVISNLAKLNHIKTPLNDRICRLLSVGQWVKAEKMKNIFFFFCLMFSFIACNKVAEIDAIFNTNNIPSQFFKIAIDKDTSIMTNGGVSLKIRKNTFQSPTNTVQLELKEVLTKGDIIESGLNTLTENGEILESDGMVFLDVEPEQKNVFGKKIDVNLPASKGVNLDMQLFSGSKTKDGVRWRMEGAITETNANKRIRSGKNNYRKSCSPCHSMKLREGLTGPALGNIHLFRDLEWLVAFTKNSQEMIAEGDSISQCLWMQYGPTVMTDFENILTDEEIEDIYFYLANESLRQSIDTNEVEYVLSCETFENPDALPNEDQGYYTVNKTNITIDTIFFSQPNLKRDSFFDVVNYQFSINNIGWSNIDYFLKNGLPVISEITTFEVELENKDLPRSLSRVLLVFKNRNIMIELQQNNGKFMIPRGYKLTLPKEEAYIIGIVENEGYLLGSKEIKIENINRHSLELNPTTMDEIKHFIHSL